MTQLTRKEIFAELKKLGVSTTPELTSYLREYYKYYLQQQINTYSPKELTAGMKDNQPNESSLLNRFSPIDPFK